MLLGEGDSGLPVGEGGGPVDTGEQDERPPTKGDDAANLEV